MKAAPLMRDVKRLAKSLDAAGKTKADIVVPFTFVQLVKAGFTRFPDGSFREGLHVLVYPGYTPKHSRPPQNYYAFRDAKERAAVREFRHQFYALGLCS
jgi:hypothetical protein